MGLLDSIRDRVSSTVTQARQSVTEVAHKVEQKASDAGHAVSSAFESKPVPPPAPSAPPPPVTARAVVSGPSGLKGALTASIGDSIKPPPVSTETQAAAKALKARHTDWKGLDEKALGEDLARQVKENPTAAAPLVRELMTQLGSGDKDDVAEVFAANLEPAQLQQLAQHPDGAAALKEMKTELLAGVSFGHEKEMAAKLGAALTEASSKPLPHTKIELAPGAFGVNDAGSRKSPTGRIPADAWADPSKLVGALTQNPATGTTSGNTCAASSMLGSALMASPEKAARFLENVARNEETKVLIPSERNALVAIADRIRNKTASYEDLSKAQDLLFRAGNTHGDIQTLATAINQRGMGPNQTLKNLTPAQSDELRSLMATEDPWTDQQAHKLEELFNRNTGMSMKMDKGENGWAPRIEGDLVTMDRAGFSDDEARKLAGLGGLSSANQAAAPTGSLAEIAAKLKPGEALSVRVAGGANDTTSNHFISIGRRDDGTLYLYNSDPDTKDATLTVGGKGAGSADFQKLLASYQDRTYVDPNGKLPVPIPYRLD